MPLSKPRIPYYPTVDKNREGDIENDTSAPLPCQVRICSLRCDYPSFSTNLMLSVPFGHYTIKAETHLGRTPRG